MTPDLINGLFEFISGLIVWFNVYALYKDKIVKGTNIYVSLFFTFWGLWNLYYYPFLNQWLSFYGGISVTISGTTWVVLAFYYTYTYRKPKMKLKWYQREDITNEIDNQPGF